MSTQYSFNRTDILEQAARLQGKLNEVKADFIHRLSEMAVPTELEDVMDTVISDLSHSTIFNLDEPDEARIVIGTASAARFNWRRENGFYDLHTVECWMKQHPEYSIYDEYGVPVCWEEFQAIVRSHNQ